MAPLPLLFMVLASSALLLALVALWSSLRRALAAVGDAAPSLEGSELPDRAALLDEKKSLLRAIKDLEYEHAVGKISPEDFRRLDLAYRVRAKEVLALLEQDLAPYRAKAEALLAARVGLEPSAARTDEPSTHDEDDAALRERARQLREEADRLERRARTRASDDKPSENSTKPSEGGEASS
ncbi:MAG: hypothetical protein ACK6CU_00870 [Deltaproteobacteria bacterium]